MNNLDLDLSVPIVEFKNFSFKYHFRNRYILKGLTFKVKEGETLLLTGSSGSGKSTILYAILGLVPHLYKGDFNGKVFVNGVNVLKSTIPKIAEKVGYIPQRVNNFITEPTVYEELAFRLENLQFQKKETRKRVFSISKELGLDHLLRYNPRQISEGEKQKTCLGATLVTYPNLILADEPLANLDHANQKRVIAFFQELKEKNYTLIISSHDVFRYASLKPKIISLQDGKLKKFDFQKLDRSLELQKIESTTQPVLYNQPNTKNEPFLTLDKVDFGYKGRGDLVFKNITLSMVKGEIIGLTGSNGSGKTTLLSLIIGVLKPVKGHISVLKRPISKLKWKEKTALFGYVSQNPELQFFEETVKDEVLLISKNLKKNLFLEDKIESVLSQAGLSNYGHYSPFSLSEGEKERLAYIASTFHDPDIILLDEVTNGMDIKNKQWLQRQIKKEKEKEKIIIIASHDTVFLNSVADTIYHIENKTLSKIDNNNRGE